jgi:dephospho-CoA kinase
MSRAPRVIGVTGSFGTGKTTVARMFRRLGAKVIDADSIAHEALRKGSSTYRKVVREFGCGVLDSSLNVDRRRLAGIAFRDRGRLARLCALIHPAVIEEITRRLGSSATRPRRAVVIDAPLLIEAGLHAIVDTLIVVKASRAHQMERCAAKFGMSKRDIRDRITHQLSLKRKIGMADFVIDNDGTIRETEKQVITMWRKLWK